jgi:hypothetical protein
MLKISFKHDTSKEWSNEILIQQLLRDRKHIYDETATSLILYVDHESLRNKVEIANDYLIEIVSGIRIVNALPYRIEVKCNESIGAKRHSLTEKIKIRLNSGRCALLPMIRSGSTFNLRIVGKYQKILKDAGSRVLAAGGAEWSPSIDIQDVFQTSSVNVTEAPLKMPCPFFPQLKVKLRKIRDPSKDESFATRYTSTPTIEILTDFWIQNNSGIRLHYRMKSKLTGESEELNDDFCGPNPMASSTLSSSLTYGPIMGLLSMSSIQFRCDLHPGQIQDRLVSFQEFDPIQIQLPNLSQQSKNKWSAKVKILSATFRDYELSFGNLYFGLSLQTGVGVFQRTKILVITPRYLIQNLTSSVINIFPVRIWKRYRISSTGAETEC